jgi:hypothetical protein
LFVGDTRYPSSPFDAGGRYFLPQFFFLFLKFIYLFSSSSIELPEEIIIYHSYIILLLLPLLLSQCVAEADKQQSLIIYVVYLTYMELDCGMYFINGVFLLSMVWFVAAVSF